MLKQFAKGLGTTLKVLFRPKKTIEYPDKKKPRAKRFRGRHELRRYSNGMEMCIGCELCQVACPADAITVIPGENDPARPHSPGERYAYRYEVDLLRCIFCGLCEEACPTDALHLTQEFELAAFSRAELVVGRNTLVTKEPSHFKVPEMVYPRYEGRVSLPVVPSEHRAAPSVRPGNHSRGGQPGLASTIAALNQAAELPAYPKEAGR